MSRLPELKFFSGRSNLKLAEAIARFDGLKLSSCKFTDFANGEIKTKLEESVRGEDVFILQTAGPPDPNKWMMELFLMCHTAQKSSARRITAVIPYIYGCRQDRKTESRTPITIQLIGSLLQASGAKRVLTVSLHNQATVSAFGGVLVDNISSSFLFAPILKEIYEEENFFVLSPDAGGVLRAKAYANRFGANLGFVYKIRPEDNKCDTLAFVGDVKDKNVVIIDDMVDTGGTHIKCAQAAKDRGAKRITLVVTHPILSTNRKTGVSAIDAILKSPIDKVITSDSIHHENLPSIFQVESLGNLLGDTIARINSDQSVGALWEKEIE